MVGVGVEKL